MRKVVLVIAALFVILIASCDKDYVDRVTAPPVPADTCHCECEDD